MDDNNESYVVVRYNPQPSYVIRKWDSKHRILFESITYDLSMAKEKFNQLKQHKDVCTKKQYVTFEILMADTLFGFDFTGCIHEENKEANNG